MHLVLLVQVDGADDTSHGLTEAFVGPETGPSEKRTLGIGHPYRYLVLFSITQIRRDVHHKRKRAPHMGHRFRLLHLRIASYRRTVHIHRRPDVHSLELQEEHPAAVFSVYGYFLTVPRFSAPATFTRTGIQVSVLLIVAMGNPYRLPSGIVERKRSHGLGLPLILLCFGIHFHLAQRHRHVLPLFGLALQSGETHIAGRGLDRQIQISSRHRLGVPHRSGMPHSREVALFMKHTELFAFRKGLPVAAVGRYFQLDFRKSRPVCVEPQFHGRQADGFTQVHSPKTSFLRIHRLPFRVDVAVVNHRNGLSVKTYLRILRQIDFLTHHFRKFPWSLPQINACGHTFSLPAARKSPQA